MRKYIVLVLALVCVLGLVGCGQEESLGQKESLRVGNLVYYSDCGTFNDTVNEKRLHLTEEQQSAERSGTPKDGTIQDGKIYFEGFGWVDYEGGGTEGIYGEDIYENGNTIER